MIKYPLRCPDGHRYESWFKSSDAFERLRDSRLLTCEVCGSAEVVKEITSPRIAKRGRGEPVESQPEAALESPPDSPLGESPLTDTEPVAIPMPSFEDVGQNFAREVRDIHEGRAEGRSLVGQATEREIKGLIDDGMGAKILVRRDNDS